MAKVRLTDRERFFKHIKKEENGCWVWQLKLTRDGYSCFKIGNCKDKSVRNVRAHRWAYEEFIGPIPKGMQIDHLCRNRSCANPDHLDVVTLAENIKRGWRANKVECKRGHPLFGDNLYLSPDGRRVCRACDNRRSKIRYRDTNGAYLKTYFNNHREKIRRYQKRYRKNRRRAK